MPQLDGGYGEIESSFPPPRRGEPADLRRDIADELADHLACAMSEELERVEDEEEARRRALGRFGDPRALARKLWWDAMKERIMKDRILMACMVVLAIGAMAAAAFSFISLRQMQQSSLAMAAALEKLATKPAPGANLANLEVQAHRGGATGLPVNGLKICLRGKAFNDSTSDDLEGRTNVQGIAAFGPIRPGAYTIMAYDPLGLNRSQAQVVLYSGLQKEETICYPEVTSTTVVLTANWPPELQGRQIFIGGSFYGQIQAADSSNWEFTSRGGMDSQRKYFDYYNRSDDPNRAIKLETSPSSRPAFIWPNINISANRLVVGMDWGTNDQGVTGFKKVIDCKFPSGPAPVFKPTPGQQNIWRIELPDEVIVQMRSAAAQMDFGSERGTVDGQLFSQLFSMFKSAGRVMKVLPINKDCMILKYNDKWANGNVNNIAVANNDGGVRTLNDWPEIPAQETLAKDRKFILALYASQTTNAFGTEATTGTMTGAIKASEIMADWPERTSWKTQPPIEEAASYDFAPGVGWKLFDVTPIVRAQTEGKRKGHGIMLHFADENMTSNKWSGYAFVSREGENEFADKHPVLLVVETDSGK